jgi:hypothetical protein
VLAWLAWLAVVVWLTAPGLLREAEYFRSPGPQFLRLLLVVLAISPVALWIYQRARRAGFWQWELALVAAIPVAASLLYEPRAAAVTLAVVFATFGLGRWARFLLGVPAEGAAEDIALSTGLGLGILHCALFLMGLAGWYTVTAFLILIAACLLIGRRATPELWTALRRLHAAWGTTSELGGWAGALVAAFGAALAICGVMVMLAPSLAFDVIRAHLPLVHYYASQHALRTPAFLNYGYFPQGVETLMTLGYVLAGDAAAQMLPPVYFVLAILMAFRIGRMCGLSVLAALAGTLFGAAIPLVHWTGSVAKNDLASAFFMLAALHGYLGWRASGNFRCVLAGAFFLAMGAGVKHSVVYAIPPLALLYAHAAMRQPARARAMVKLAAIFLVFGTFWQIRTWVLTGNPVYPFSVASAVPAGNGNVVTRLARLPWDVHFNGRAYFESPLDHPMGIVLALFAPLWVLARKRMNRAEGVCLFFCALYLVYWGTVQGMPRFAIAPILILNVLTAARVIDFCRGMPPAVKTTIYAASAYALLFGLLGGAIIEINAPQLRYFAWRINRQGYLRAAMAPYRPIAFLQSLAHPGDAILSVDNCPLAYAPNPGEFRCLWEADAAVDRVRALLGRRDYRFLIVPAARSDLAPAGWRAVYADELYRVYEQDRLP